MKENIKPFEKGEEIRKNNPAAQEYEKAVNTMIIAQHHIMMLPELWK